MQNIEFELLKSVYGALARAEASDPDIAYSCIEVSITGSQEFQEYLRDLDAVEGLESSSKTDRRRFIYAMQNAKSLIDQLLVYSLRLIKAECFHAISPMQTSQINLQQEYRDLLEMALPPYRKRARAMSSLGVSFSVLPDQSRLESICMGEGCHHANSNEDHPIDTFSYELHTDYPNGVSSNVSDPSPINHEGRGEASFEQPPDVRRLSNADEFAFTTELVVSKADVHEFIELTRGSFLSKLALLNDPGFTGDIFFLPAQVRSYVSTTDKLKSAPSPPWPNLDVTKINHESGSVLFTCQLFMLLRRVLHIPYAQAQTFPDTLLHHIVLAEPLYSVVCINKPDKTGTNRSHYYCFPSWVMYLLRVYSNMPVKNINGLFFLRASNPSGLLGRTFSDNYDLPTVLRGVKVNKPPLSDAKSAIHSLLGTLNAHMAHYDQQKLYHVWFLALCRPVIEAIQSDINAGRV